MFPRLTSLLLALTLIAPPGASAQTIPGADAPELRAAAYAWLNGEGTTEELRAFGEIAADGNVAARLLVSGIFQLYLPDDFPELDRKERLALFPPDRTGDAHTFRPYRVELDRIPAFKAYRRIHGAETPEAWIADAKNLLAAGLREKFLDQLGIALNNPALFVEALKFAETVVKQGDHAHTELMFLRGLEPAMLDYLDATARAAARRARWQEPPWTPEREAALAEELRDGHWPAIVALGLLTRWNPEILKDRPEFDLYRKWGAASFGADPPDAAEIDAIGNLLIRDAARTPYLAPMLTACSTHCPDSTAACMANGIALGLNRSVGDLEPVIAQEDLLRSERAARLVLASAGSRAHNGDFSETWRRMPACFRDAAERAAAARR